MFEDPKRTPEQRKAEFEDSRQGRVPIEATLLALVAYFRVLPDSA